MEKQAKSLFEFDESGEKLIKYLGAELDAEDVEKMFNGTGVSVRVPDGVKTIGERAFMLSDVSEVVLPEGVETVESDAFALMVRLKKVVLPSTLKTIGEGAFGGCVALKEIYIPKSVENIGANAFGQCGKLKIFLEGEIQKGFVEYTEEKVEYVDESYAFDFHRGGVSPPSYVEYRTTVIISWNPDGRPIKFNVARKA